MKKIGILTLPLHKNYGGILQAYALQKKLKDKGHYAIILDRQWDRSFFDDLKMIVKKFFFKEKIESEKAIKSNTSYFINKYINKTPPIYSETKLKKVVEELKFDTLVAGSDQVWRLEYTKAFCMNYFFNFISNSTCRKISYAASFGEDTWNHSKEITNKVKKLLSYFDAVSVREDSSIDLCKSNFDLDVQLHLDPTMLLTSNDYLDLIKLENEPEREGDVLIYMLDINRDRQKTIDKVCNNINGIPFSINVKSINPKDDLQNRIYPTVTSWLKGFQDAKFVITDSFHGTVFSILFNKPFIAYGNVERGLSRFTSLLRMFNLENRFILENKDLNINILREQINWNDINSKLALHRLNSEKYFDENI